MNLLCRKVMPVFYLTQALSLSTILSLRTNVGHSNTIGLTKLSEYHGYKYRHHFIKLQKHFFFQQGDSGGPLVTSINGRFHLVRQCYKTSFFFVTDAAAK